MDSVGKVLGFLKDSVIFIMTELKQLERMNSFISNNILTYEVAINNLLDTIQELNNPMYNHIISQSTLCSILSLVNSHVLSLNKLVIRMNKWNDDIKKGGFKKFRALVRNRPSVLSEELFTKLLEIKPLLVEICQIEKEALGSGTRIKHPLLKASWVLSGRNQVNDSAIEKSIIAENIYLLLKIEMGGEIKRPDVWKRAIGKFVDGIDGCAASSIDDKISVSEMNEFVMPENKKTFKEVLLDYIDVEITSSIINNRSSSDSPKDSTGSDTESDSETSNNKVILYVPPEMKNETITIPIDFTGKTLNYNSKVEIPQCSGYGSNWPSSKLCEFTIPESNYSNLEFNYLEILCNGTDQGWGDTGHDNVRYQINDQPIQVGFFIHRLKCPDNNYKFVINWEKAKPGDKITMWLVCAPFGGWQAKMNTIVAKAYFE